MMNSHEVRDNLIGLIIAQRREGKSKFIATQLIPAYTKRGLKTIIIQPKYNSWYANHPDVHTTADINEVMQLIHNTYNAAIVIEEARVYFNRVIDKEILTAIINTGQCNVDMYFLYQAWGFVCKDLFRVADTFTIFRTKDKPEDRRDCLGESELIEINNGLLSLKKHGDYFDIIR